MIAGYARRPGVAETVGCAGLEGDLGGIRRQPPRHTALRRRCVFQDAQDLFGAVRAHQPVTARLGHLLFVLDPPDQRLGMAIIAKRGVEHGQFARRQPCPAERQRQAGLLVSAL